MAQGRRHGLPIGLAAGFDGRVQSPILRLLGQRLQKAGLGEGFAARKGHAAAGAVVEFPVELHFLHDLGHAQVAAADREGVGVADVLAQPALRQGATLPVKDDARIRRGREAVVGTGLHALAAPDAVGGDVHELGGGPDVLRVLAPQAMQWATLEKDDGPDAGAVVDGKTLEVADHAGRVVGIDAPGREQLEFLAQGHGGSVCQAGSADRAWPRPVAGLRASGEPPPPGRGGGCRFPVADN